MRENKKIFFIIYIIIIALAIMFCFFTVMGYINRQSQLSLSTEEEGRKKFTEYIYKTAETYCEANIDNFEQYTCIEKKHIESLNSYIMLFKKENNILFIALTYNAEVTAVSILNQDEFYQYKNMEIDNAKVNDFISDELRKKYATNFKNFRDKERKLRIIDDKLVLECYVETELKNGKPFFRDDLILYTIGE